MADGDANTRESGSVPRLSRQRILPPLAVHQLFDELHALELDQLRVLFRASIERHADLPWPRKNARILDCGFVADDVGTRPRIALDHMQRVGMEVPRAVEP